jgi:hypothetical protein
MSKRGGAHAEQRRAADHALAADQPHLHGIALVGAGENRHETIFDEIKMLDRHAGMLQEV